MDDMNFYVDSNHFFDVQHNSKTLIGTLNIYLHDMSCVVCHLRAIIMKEKRCKKKATDNELVIFHRNQIFHNHLVFVTLSQIAQFPSTRSFSETIFFFFSLYCFLLLLLHFFYLSIAF